MEIVLKNWKPGIMPQNNSLKAQSAWIYCSVFEPYSLDFKRYLFKTLLVHMAIHVNTLTTVYMNLKDLWLEVESWFCVGLELLSFWFFFAAHWWEF